MLDWTEPKCFVGELFGRNIEPAEHLIFIISVLGQNRQYQPRNIRQVKYATKRLLKLYLAANNMLEWG